MTLIVATDRWRREHVGAAAAVVAWRDLKAIENSQALTLLKRDLEQSLKGKYGEASKAQMLEEPTLAAYEAYDRRFGQNYHVAMQIRSVAQKGKLIPDRNVLVEAMFMTELAFGVLAAAQDLDQLTLPITIDGTDGSEAYTRYDGVEEHCKAGDQVLRDGSGRPLSSIAQGPTNVALVTPETTSVVYCFYFPVGVSEQVQDEALAYLETCVLAGNPGAVKVGSSRAVAG